ncbi:hypothetical protein M378DRAFT_172594 [Amanita muscaria Koide BX008]|uniref:Uncharacterized protein n=1 Tax=Amanita muscaria (strain Koide BX008) TaxID=946122 RepID=A0A0C2WIT0_AMAMK|nr:hypothetical protein M378DRAFT_172594 [Amanita muscaria Koide BX008]
MMITPTTGHVGMKRKLRLLLVRCVVYVRLLKTTLGSLGVPLGDVSSPWPCSD